MTTSSAQPSRNVDSNRTENPVPSSHEGGQIQSLDIEFSVPCKHRLRFTKNIAQEDFATLSSLIEPSTSKNARALLVVDRAVLSPQSAAVELVRRLTQIDRVDWQGQEDRSGKTQSYLGIDGGEAVKNDSRAVDKVLAAIHHGNLDRRSYVIVIGGGAVLDAVGYAAAIAHRGVRLIRLPTTSLAQADSGVGVKNAINAFDKKNWIGTFAVPWAVINDASLLESLSDRDFRCGFSEAVKVSLLKSKDDFDWLHRVAGQIRKRDPELSFEAIRRSCIWHLNHITKGGDPFENLEARPLDYGHWSAHRMEALSHYEIRHGEAVGIGVALDTLYSVLACGLPKDDAIRVCQTLKDLGLSLWHSTLDSPTQVIQGLEEFRQHLGGRLTITLLQGIGDPVNVHEINESKMFESIDWLKQIAQS